MDIIYFILKALISIALLFMVVPVLIYFISYQWKYGQLSAWMNFMKNPKNKQEKDKDDGKEE